MFEKRDHKTNVLIPIKTDITVRDSEPHFPLTLIGNGIDFDRSFIGLYRPD